MKTIPYIPMLSNCGGAFITPSNETFYVNNNHENFAMNYCHGEYYYLLNSIKNSYPAYNFEEFKLEYNLDINKEDIDIFSSSSLTIEQLNLFKLWLKSHKLDYRTCYTDFLVYLLGFDKVENILKNTITTSNKYPHIRFYNYYLMDWNIDTHNSLKYNPNTKLFEPLHHDNTFVASYLDREYEEEIYEIKSKVKLKDRPYFFK